MAGFVRRRFERLHLMGSALVALVLVGPLLVASPAAAVPTGFITRQGTELLLDGNPYRFSGLNIFNANSDGWCGAQMAQGTRLDDALTSMGSGASTFRSWFFQPLAIDKITRDRDWSAFDHTLQVAAAHGKKVIATLTDQWGECGSDVAGNGYKTADWYVTGYQQVQPGMLVSYRDWVAEVVARYQDDPRIAFWQLINEAEVTPCPPGDLQPYQTLHDWATDVSGLVKSIDANHLVSLGTIGSGQCGADGPRYKDIHAIPAIDLCEYHDYGAPNAGMPGDEFNGLQLRIDQCDDLGKPLFVGEAGIIPNDVGGTLQHRADAFRVKIDTQFSAGVSGFLAWAWSPQDVPVSTLDNYDIGPGDPSLDALAAPPLIVQIAVGGQHTCALSSEGGVWCWGGNDHGELGDGTQLDRLNPKSVQGLDAGVTAIAAGANHACALTASGAVVCWGFNQAGQLGDGTHQDRLVPTPVPDLLSGVTAIAAGSYHTCAVLAAGGVECWGAANRGQLGYGDPSPPWFTSIDSPTPVDGLSSGAVGLAAGDNHACARIAGGGAKCWGANEDFGQVGDGTASDRNTASDVVVVGQPISDISPGGQHTCAIVSAGASCWGRNVEGQLGDGTTTSRRTADDVAGLTTEVVDIESGGQYTCAIVDAGAAKCWGRNEAGQLGDGSTTPRMEPVDVSGLSSGVQAISASDNHSCAIVGSGNVKCWGLNFFGELGDGTTIERDTPVDVVWLPPDPDPDDPSGLAQFEANGTTSIPVGATTDGTSVVLKATVSDPDGGSVRLQVEVKPVGTAFDGSGLVTSTAVGSGSIGSATVTGLLRATGYHWRARTLDGSDQTSQDWVSFGADAETVADFLVERPIVFSSTRHGSNNANHQEIYSMAPDGSLASVVRLTTNSTVDTDPSLSPDGTKITFESNRDGDYEIFVMDVGGSDVVKLTTNTAVDQAAVWSPDGTKIAFVSNRITKNNYDVWTMNADGTGVAERLTTVVSTDTTPTWSPDGTKIAFMSTRDGDEEIFVMNANGSGQQPLTANNRRDLSPAWSPGGTRIAFTSNREAVNNLDIYAMNVDGSSVIRLTTKAKDDALPAWSGAGLRIVFQGIDTDNDWEIYRVAASGGSLTKLTTNGRTDVAPGW
ncbi:MAG TPA: DPP IV N-terminal domain-containing protein [Actinomycetota bacterium]